MTADGTAPGGDRVRAIADTILEAFIEQDASGRITDWNPQAEALFGYTREEAIGLPSWILIPERNRERHTHSLGEILRTPALHVRRREITAVRRDGREFRMQVAISRVPHEGEDRLVTFARDLTDLEVRDARVYEAQQALRHLVDGLEDGYFEVDLSLAGRYQYVNDAFCRITGYARDELIGHSFKKFFDAETIQVLYEAYNHVYQTREPLKALEYSLVTKEGTRRYVEESVSLRCDAEGKPAGFMGIRRDCTARKLAERELAAAKEAAEVANKAKGEFLANMSHEIRTPMNGIIGMTELALATELTPYQTECLATVKSSAQSLLTILNDILDFSKIESRKLELESIPFALVELVNETLKPLAVKAHQKGLEVLADIAPDVPARVIGDPVRLKQVLTNLLGNAIKFTERGHVMVSIRAERRAQGCARLGFLVSDTGIGIPPEKHATIFEAFSQGDGSTTRRFGGTGLGLAISSTLVHLMGGDISVESRPNVGSTFQFTLDFDTAEPAVPAPSDRMLAGMPVLVIDDNDVNRRILQAQLLRWRMAPVCVADGPAALAALAVAVQEGKPFPLVLLDSQMPGQDGFDVATAIGARPELAGATIMMLTSGGRYGDVTRCRDLGISAYLTKPVRESDLFDAICRALESPSAAPVPGAARLEPARRRLRVLLAEDNMVNQRVAVGLLTKRGHDVVVANDGLEALEAFDHGTFDVVLMDLQMPRMGGFEATAAIRERERRNGGRTRIVAMTAHAMSGDRERCLAASMDGYLAKPVDPALFFAAVEAADATPQAPAARPVSFDREALLERLGGDADLLADVLALFLEDCPRRLAAIRAAIDARDGDRLRQEAHALKGAAGNVSANGVFDAARTLERLGSEGRFDAAAGAWRLLSTEAAMVMDLFRRTEIAKGSTAV